MRVVASSPKEVLFLTSIFWQQEGWEALGALDSRSNWLRKTVQIKACAPSQESIAPERADTLLADTLLVNDGPSASAREKETLTKSSQDKLEGKSPWFSVLKKTRSLAPKSQIERRHRLSWVATAPGTCQCGVPIWQLSSPVKSWISLVKLVYPSNRIEEKEKEGETNPWTWWFQREFYQTIQKLLLISMPFEEKK